MVRKWKTLVGKRLFVSFECEDEWLLNCFQLMNNYYVMEKRTDEISDVFERLAQNEHVSFRAMFAS